MRKQGSEGAHRSPSHTACHCQAWKPGPVWLQSPCLSDLTAHTHGKLGVTKSAREAGQANEEADPSPSPLSLTSRATPLGTGVLDRPGDQAGSVDFCLQGTLVLSAAPQILWGLSWGAECESEV